MEENNKEEKEQINIELNEAKGWSWNDENAIDFRWLGVQKEDDEDITLANFFESFAKKANWWWNFFKKVTRWLFDNCCIVPNEKIRRSFLKYFLILKSSI